MMHQDYILRMIQQLRHFMAGILKVKDAGDYEEAEVLLRDSYGRFVGLSPTLVHAISEDDLIQLLQARGGIDAQRALALAEILREEGDLYLAMEREEEAIPRLTKSLRLYLELFAVDEEFASRDLPGFASVIEETRSYQLSTQTTIKLIEYLEWNGQYDIAENQLVDALDEGQIEEQMLRNFYERLLALDDARLIVGGLNRAEVSAARDSLSRSADGEGGKSIRL